MHPIEPSDIHAMNAAEGWLMLGNPREAWNELARVRPELAEHPLILAVKWNLFAAEKRWLDAVVTADHHVHTAPDDPSGWVHRSFALHEVRRTREAFDLLLPAFERFPGESTIAYNLACYTCQLGDLPAARKWFERALASETDAEARREHLRNALGDADLKLLWSELRKRLAAH